MEPETMTGPIFTLLRISIADQRLYAFSGNELTAHFPVSTAASGAGEINGSGCTPRGRHQVRARIGDGLPEGAVLKGRRWTGEIWTPQLALQYPGRDWILSRILWLSGCEVGVNRLGDVDTFRRYIYLHGTPDGEGLGTPLSHGCIRLSNFDIIRLYDCVPAHCTVSIEEQPFHHTQNR